MTKKDNLVKCEDTFPRRLISRFANSDEANAKVLFKITCDINFVDKKNNYRLVRKYIKVYNRHFWGN